MTILRGLVFGAVAALGLSMPAAGAERAVIVLDGSGSMWAQVDGKARITIARETLGEVLASMPDDLELGLMTYGHREKGNCDDIEMLVEPATGTAEAIVAAAEDINPKGKTPLSAAVRLAAEALRFTEDKATVILVTDGLETCEVDPCALGSELEAQGVDFTTHVLGFGLSDEEGRQVACLAENTGGRYLSAQNGADLVEALTTTVAEAAEVEPEAPEPAPAEPAALEKNFTVEAVLAEGGEPLTFDTDEGFAWTLRQGETTVDYGYDIPDTFIEPGEYELEARFGKAVVKMPVTITADEVAKPYVVLNAGTVVLRAYAAEGQPVDSGAALNIYFTGDDDYGYGEATFRGPAGEVTVTARVGESEVSETFTLAAGEVVEKDLVAGVGVAAISGSYVAGTAIEADGMAVNVFKAKKAMDGSREEVTYGYGPNNEFQLAPGDYVAVVRMDEAQAEAPFSVTSGERTDVNVVLEAGVVAFDMPGAEAFNLYEAKADISGQRKERGYGYGMEHQTTLEGGDYVISVRYADEVETEVPFTVVPGERLELTVDKPAGGKTK